MANVRKTQIDKAAVESAVEPELQVCTDIEAPASYNLQLDSAQPESIAAKPVQKKSKAAPARSLATPEIEAPQPPANHASFNRALAAAPMPPPPERKPFWPVGLLAVAVGAGFYFYHKAGSHPAPTEAARAPASLIVAPAPDSLIDSEVHKSPVSAFMVPVQSEAPETSATLVLKSDNDNFRVLVNGKEMPVISGKISLPLNQEFDIRFVRRGHKEIKMVTQTSKPGVQEVQLKFEPLADAPAPAKL